jgi:hypothetical protein
VLGVLVLGAHGKSPGPAGAAGPTQAVLPGRAPVTIPGGASPSRASSSGAHPGAAHPGSAHPGSATHSSAIPSDAVPGSTGPGSASPGGGAQAARPAAAEPAAARPTIRAVPRGLAFALVTGLFIATYTLWDKFAVSTLGVPPLLQGYASLPVMVLVIAPFALRERPRTTRVWHDYRRQVAGAAVLSPLAYVLVLVALSFTAVAAVAPAREVSVLAGVLLGRTMLGEQGLAWRLAAAAAIAAGIICIAVG